MIATLLAGWAWAGDATGTLVVEMSGFETDAGAAMVTVFDDPKAYPTKPDQAVRAVKGTIADGRCTLRIEDLPHGTYAVSVFHDVNGNGRLDSKWLVIPNEPVGASRDAKGSMGPPRFRDAAVELASEELTVPITVAPI